MEKNIENIAKQYYNIHQEYANSLIIHDKNEPELVNDQDLVKTFLNDLTNRLKVKLIADGKVSNVLMKQLLIHHRQVGEKYVIQNDNKEFITVKEFFQSREILDLIELIEQNKCTAERIPFKKYPLKGLGHVHHGAYASKGYSAVKNCLDYWYYKGIFKEGKNAELQALLDESEHDLGARMYQKAIFSKINNGLTGEWLIYKKYQGKNYYLCLAKHDEGDENIYKNKVLPCLNDFPELKDVLNEEIKIVKQTT
jgi:hypothetical protein